MKNFLIACLGNPGNKYEKTRHNAGFMFADYFRDKETDLDFSEWKINKKLNSGISAGKISGIKIILLKPLTFMNLSGEAIKKALSFYKIKPESLVVVHDEIDLPLGKYKFSKDSSSAGHQGVQHIINILGTKDFTRLRIGIENREDKTKIPTEKYVLGKFTIAELRTLKKTLEKASAELKNKV
jgi:peptidyl-tRNA hydrolase, PTH1 family